MYYLAARCGPSRLRVARDAFHPVKRVSMPVNYTPPTPEQLLPVPGVTLGTAPVRIKNWSRDDLLLVSLAAGTQAAGVFTQNRFCAAPVTVCREHLARAAPRALLINAGNANAGTGARGL